MAEWKTQVNYNYNPTFHAYTYGFVYQTGPEQNHAVSGNDWSENCEPNSYNGGGAAQSHIPARSREESPPRSPEQQPESGHYFQDSGVVYIREPQTGRLVMAGQHRVGYDGGGENRTRRTGSDSASDSEAHTSPDSWSSGSNYERSVPQTDSVVWVKSEEQTGARSPDHSDDVSSSLMDEPQSFAVHDSGVANSSTHASCTTTKKQGTSIPNVPKAKVRAAFSESQMSTLVQRFSVQRYLTPAEMKNLADVTGLTYKQVKTWFQNRRMKLRRHQKDTSWVSERYAVKDNTATDTVFSNVAPHAPTYQGDGMSHLRDHYNQHMMGAAFKNNPHNLAFYLAAMGNPTGTAGYPPWSSSPSQAAVPSRPQVPGWPLPPGRSQFEFCPIPYDSSGAASLNNFERNGSLDNKDGESVGGPNAAILHNAVQ